MNNRLLLLCFVVVGVVAMAFRPSSWVSVNLDERASVTLPANYLATPGVAPAQILSGSDSVGVYIAITSPLGADFQGAQRQEYYASMIGEIVQQCHGTVQDRFLFSLGGYDGVEAAVRGTRPDNHQPFFVCLRGLLVGKKAYLFQFVPANGGTNSQAQRKPFFNSITLKSLPAPGK